MVSVVRLPGLGVGDITGVAPVPDFAYRTDLAELLANYFNTDSSFNERVPEDLFGFSEQVFGREDLQLSEDVVRHAWQCAEGAVQAERGRQILGKFCV